MDLISAPRTRAVLDPTATHSQMRPVDSSASNAPFGAHSPVDYQRELGFQT